MCKFMEFYFSSPFFFQRKWEKVESFFVCCVLRKKVSLFALFRTFAGLVVTHIHTQRGIYSKKLEFYFKAPGFVCMSKANMDLIISSHFHRDCMPLCGKGQLAIVPDLFATSHCRHESLHLFDERRWGESVLQNRVYGCRVPSTIFCAR
jgi:hypothetical protein